MTQQFMRVRTHQDVHRTLANITAWLLHSGDSRDTILHCLDPRQAGFYRHIDATYRVTIRTCARAPGLKSSITQLLLGARALIHVNRTADVLPLFLQIGEQGLAALYVVDSSKGIAVSDLAAVPALAVRSAVQKDPSHLVYQVDEGSDMTDGKAYEFFSVGQDCPVDLKLALELGQPAAVFDGATA